MDKDSYTWKKQIQISHKKWLSLSNIKGTQKIFFYFLFITKGSIYKYGFEFWKC